MYVPTAVAGGTKLLPDTPIPLQLPPTGDADKATNVSLRQILAGNGVIVMALGVVTVKVAAPFDVIVEQLLLAITRYRKPLDAIVTAGTTSEALFAPAIFVQVAPPSVLTCHW